jgi:hypothetical protein
MASHFPAPWVASEDSARSRSCERGNRLTVLQGSLDNPMSLTTGLRALSQRVRSLRTAAEVAAVRLFRPAYASYLNDKASLVRNATTFPCSTFKSIFVTSATRRSLSDLAAVSTARVAASSQEEVLIPITSTIL